MNQTFSELGLNPDRIAGLEAAGYESPSKLQCEVIPQLLAGHDLVVEAAPGSGKTVAFCLPILQTLNPDVQGAQALVLVPSGNDATRVAAQFQALGNPAERRVVPVFDEQPIAREAERLRQFVSVVVGTPERVREHLSRGSFDLENLQVVIVDGVDELLVNNQQAVLDDLLEMTPAGRQTALFSGLLDAELQALADQYLFEPVLLKRLAGAVSMPVIKHRYQGLLTTDRVTALARLLDGENITRALIFANQRSSAEEVASALRVLGYGAEVIHGATSADAADAAVRNWREDFLDFLVLTDRGAGESALEADEVISFDMPTDAECYARRARLVAENGSLITLVSPRERRLLGEIESFTGQRVKAVLLTSRASAVVQRAEAFRQRVRDSLTHPAIETYLLLLNDLAEEGIDWADIAAAIATMTQQGGQSEPVFTPRRSSSSERRPSAPSARSSERREPAARPPREREREEDREVEAGYTRLIMDAGYDIGVRPKDIVGAIANEANIPGRAVGNIDIRDNFTYIEVQQDYIDRVLTRVPNTRLRGRVVSFRRA